jgi:hypothetical protein
MPVYQINLIRARTTPPGRRRAIFLGMMVYLLVCGGILAWMANGASRQFVYSSRLRTQITALEQQFRREHPGKTDILAYGKDLKQSLQELTGSLEAVRKVCGQRVDVARVLLRILLPPAAGRERRQFPDGRSETQAGV